MLASNKGKAIAAITLFWLFLAVSAVLAALSYLRFSEFLSLMQALGGDRYMGNTAYGEKLLLIESLFYGFAFFAAFLLLILWFRRAYRNLWQKAGPLILARGWAAGGWICPVVSLYMPYQMMRELYRVTDALLAANRLYEEGERRLKTGLLPLWWTLWVASGFYSFFLFYYMDGIELETLRSRVVTEALWMVSYLLDIPMCLLTIRVVGKYAKREALLRALPDYDETKGALPFSGVSAAGGILTDERIVVRPPGRNLALGVFCLLFFGGGTLLVTLFSDNIFPDEPEWFFATVFLCAFFVLLSLFVLLQAARWRLVLSGGQIRYTPTLGGEREFSLREIAELKEFFGGQRVFAYSASSGKLFGLEKGFSGADLLLYRLAAEGVPFRQ